MSKVETATLVAYIDGELDRDAATAIEAALRADPGLAAQLAALQRTDAAVKAAFASVLDASPPPLALKDGPPAVALQPATTRRPMPWLALAAGTAGLILGFTAGQLSPDWLTDDTAVAEIEEHLPEVLERAVSGTTVHFQKPMQGVSGAVTPMRTFRNADGSFCRAYKASVRYDGETVRSHGIACRDEIGRWRTRLQVNDI